MNRSYVMPEKLPDEDNWAWCQRAAACIPAEALACAVVDYLIGPHGRQLRMTDTGKLLMETARSMPAEHLMRCFVAMLDARHKQRPGRPEAWSIVGMATGHGSGVSSAIAERFRVPLGAGGERWLR